MLIGMASKNAVLIVEFSNQLSDEGLPLTKAVTEACRERLRPILMTAISTVIGAVPLIIATGPGAAARQSLGTAIVGGMCVATVLSLFVVPVLYIVIKTAESQLRRSRQPAFVGVTSATIGSDGDGNGDGHGNREGHGDDAGHHSRETTTIRSSDHH